MPAGEEAAALDRLRGEPFRHREPRLARILETIDHWLPQGQMLPEHILRRRHRTIVWLMWLHVVGLTAFGLFQGQPVGHMAFECALLTAPAVLATSEWVSMRMRVAAASFGLMAIEYQLLLKRFQLALKRHALCIQIS